MSVIQSAKIALSALLDAALLDGKPSKFTPPAPGLAVAHLEWIISQEPIERLLRESYSHLCKIRECPRVDALCFAIEDILNEHNICGEDDGEGEDKCANWRSLGDESEHVAGCG
jgi:hypothetical protein